MKVEINGYQQEVYKDDDGNILAMWSLRQNIGVIWASGEETFTDRFVFKIRLIFLTEQRRLA